MTTNERIQAVVEFGFTERQARFLVLGLRHAGVCVPRQYARFAGIANGGAMCNAFFARLVRRGYAVKIDCVHNRAGLYRIQSKRLFYSIGEPNSRYRRAVPARLAIERLTLLDAVLASGDLNWLATDAEKAAFAATVTGTQGTPSVETAKVVAQALDKTATIPGDLTPYQGVNLNARVGGFVESVAVDRGSWVKRGQSLATISAPELRAQRAEAEAKLQAVRAQQAEAEANTVAAQSTFDRLKAASATPGVVAGHDLEIAERSLEAARAHVNALQGSAAAAEAAVKAVAEMEAYLRVNAPFDGVITERNVHPGSLVGPSTGPLLRIEQVSRLRLTVPVPESYVGSITIGTKVEFRVTAYPDQTFQGVIARPAHSLDMKTRSMLVELDVTNPKQVLAPGMFAEVEWPISRPQTSLFVPRTAVVRTSERQFVVRVRNGVAEWVDVRRGELDGEVIEVFGDLRPGDDVVRRGNDEIRPGTRIATEIVR